MRRFIIFLTLLFALFAFINAIDAATHENTATLGIDAVLRETSGK